VWDVELGKCLICFNFGRPIASLAFHAAGIFLAVASGHKVNHAVLSGLIVNMKLDMILMKPGQ